MNGVVHSGSAMSPAPLSGSRTAAATVRGNVRAVCAPNNAIPSAQHCRRGHPTSPSTPGPSRRGHPHLHIRVARRLPGAGVGLVGVPATPHPNWLSGKGHCLAVGAVGSRPGREPGAPKPPHPHLRCVPLPLGRRTLPDGEPFSHAGPHPVHDSGRRRHHPPREASAR